MKNIGVIYCSPSNAVAGREIEMLADGEVIEIAEAVKAALGKHGYRVDLVNLDGYAVEDLRQYDWVFNLAESVCGFCYSDYQVVEMLENLGIGFTGSGSITLRNCLHKAQTKAELRRHGIWTPDYEVFSPGVEIRTQLTFPLFVKPVHEDGSIGIAVNSIVQDVDELKWKVEDIHRVYQQDALVERYIDGRDIGASVLGNNGEALVLPLSECVYLPQVTHKILTYESKWVVESAAYQTSRTACPCSLDPETEELIRRTALNACQVLDCHEYTRVDFRLYGKIPFLLEVNPSPSINPHGSGFVESAKEAGLGFEDLVIRILDDSIRRRQKAGGTSIER